MDVSAQSSLRRPGNALAGVSADLAGDGPSCVIVGNDFGSNDVYIPEAGGMLVESSGRFGLDAYNHAMGFAVADFDGDGRTDLYVTEAGADDEFLARDQRFVDASVESGVADATRDHFAWGVAAEDFDSDGDIDLFVANSYRARSGELASVFERMFAPSAMALHAAPVQGDDVGENCGDGHFRFTVLPAPGRFQTGGAIAVAAGDVDGDGSVDVLLTPYRSPPRLLHNASGGGRHLVLDLIGDPPNTDAVGARVDVTAGGRVQHRFVSAGSAGGHGSRLIHVGLGPADHASVHVRWPDGRTSSWEGSAPAQTLTLRP